MKNVLPGYRDIISPAIAFLVPLLLAAALLDAGAPGFVSYRLLPLVTFSAAAVVMASPGRLHRNMLAALWPLLVFPVLLGIYWLNPTHQSIDGVGLLPVPAISWLPGSADPARTADALAITLTAISLFVLGLSVLPRHFALLRGLLLLVGALAAVTVVRQRLSPGFRVRDAATFVNPNHFAAFAILLLPPALSGAVRMHYSAFQNGRASSPAGLHYLAAFMLAMAVWMTGSRVGWFLTLGVLSLWALLQGRLYHRYRNLAPTSRFWSLALSLVVGVSALGMLTHSLTAGFFAWSRLSGDLAFRGLLARDTLAVIGDNLPWGTGPGTFVTVFPYYQEATPQRMQVAHAHNEPLQMLAEFGVIGTALLLAAVVLIWRGLRCKRHGSNQWPGYGEIELPAFMIALGAVFLHGLFDFPLRSLPMVMLVSLWLSQLATGGSKPKKTRSQMDAGAHDLAPGN